MASSTSSRSNSGSVWVVSPLTTLPYIISLSFIAVGHGKLLSNSVNLTALHILSNLVNWCVKLHWNTYRAIVCWQDVFPEAGPEAARHLRQGVAAGGLVGHTLPAVHGQRGREQVVPRVLLPTRRSVNSKLVVAVLSNNYNTTYNYYKAVKVMWYARVIRTRTEEIVTHVVHIKKGRLPSSTRSSSTWATRRRSPCSFGRHSRNLARIDVSAKGIIISYHCSTRGYKLIELQINWI